MSNSESFSRRTFLEQAAVSVPVGAALVGCKSKEAPPKAEKEPVAVEADPAQPAEAAPAADEVPEVPTAKPDDWDPVKFNTERGKAGAIPEAYIDDITGPDGVSKHLGKHLPYIPAKLPADAVEPGWVALMWGDPDKGHTMHPNAPKSEDNPEGHWYNWIEIALDGEPDTAVKSEYDNWPKPSNEVNGKITALEGDDPTENGGKNTVYLAELPEGAKKGDVVRIWAHCLTHGEYVDFIEL